MLVGGGCASPGAGAFDLRMPSTEWRHGRVPEDISYPLNQKKKMTQKLNPNKDSVTLYSASRSFKLV